MSENKVLKGINFPGLEGTYYVPEAIAVEDENGYIEIKSYVSDTVEIENLDTTLTKEGYAADAKAVGGALEAKAPAGFGLGSTSVGAVTLADIDGSSFTLIPTGWYRLVDNLGVGITIDGTQFNPAQMRIESEVFSGQMSITLFRNGDPIVRRSFVRGFWNPWEWISPPYKFGEVYRTTERYNGLPVYAIEVATGGFAHGITSFSFNKGFTDDPNYVPAGWNVIAFDNVIFHDAVYGNNSADVIADYSASKYIESISAKFTETGLKIDIALKTTNFSGESTMNFVVKFVKTDIV